MCIICNPQGNRWKGRCFACIFCPFIISFRLLNQSGVYYGSVHSFFFSFLFQSFSILIIGIIVSFCLFSSFTHIETHQQPRHNRTWICFSVTFEILLYTPTSWYSFYRFLFNVSIFLSHLGIHNTPTASQCLYS